MALQLALEDRHRAITFVNLGCSGAEIVRGLFDKMTAREHYDASPNRTRDVPSQFDQLTALICRTAARQTTTYRIKEFAPGSTQASEPNVPLRYCPQADRRRDIDLVLLSIGGNDVGFGALAAYTFLDSVGDIARVARIQERELRFGPDVADVYLAALDGRLDAVRRALDTGFGVDRHKVVHASYEPVANDEASSSAGAIRTGRPSAWTSMPSSSSTPSGCARCRASSTGCWNGCSASPSQGRAAEAARRPAAAPASRWWSSTSRNSCAAASARAIPAPTRTLMLVPRIRIGTTDFSPYLPRDYRPYAHHQRLFRTPNDAFLTANEHRGGETPLFDILQPAVAALYSGAFHPNAEAHALVADHVMPHVRRIVGHSDVLESGRQ